jgi:uncharacterized membrane protein YbhN (UPF0104 family)
VRVTRRRVIGSVIFVVAIVAFLYFGLPRLVGFGTELRRLRDGDPWWLMIAVLLQVVSRVGYMALFRSVFVHRTARIGWRASYEITMAGLAATRLFAAAGAGGIALTVWALLGAGLERRLVAARMVAFLVLMYGVYMLTLVVCGSGLYLGILAGHAPFAITVVPAIIGGVVILVVLSIAAVPSDFDRLVARWTRGAGRIAVVARRAAAVPAAAASGVRTAIDLIRSRDPGLLGAPGFWAFDIATLWACFHAFGASPPHAVIVQAYFVGWIANTLPLPGGVGGVEGGLIGAFSAFSVNVQSAVLAVLAYRAISFWLPTIPGAIAYLQLRRTVQRWRQEPISAPAAG